MYLKLITILLDNNDKFDVHKLDQSITDLGIKSNLDSFLIHWVFLNYKYPITESEKFSSVFSKQDDLSSKIGVLSRHLIKTAKDVGVDQYLIDHYCKCKKEFKFYDRWYEEFDDSIDELNKSKIRIKSKREVWNHQFNSVTFKLITETLKK